MQLVSQITGSAIARRVVLALAAVALVLTVMAVGQSLSGSQGGRGFASSNDGGHSTVIAKPKGSHRPR